MTEKESRLVSMVMDEDTIRNIAWLKWSALKTIREVIVLKLAKHVAVHSELGLKEGHGNTLGSLAKAMEEHGIAIEAAHKERMTVHLNKVQIEIMLQEDGLVCFVFDSGTVKLNLCGESIARLLLFIDAVLPDVEAMLQKKCLELEREELGLSIAGQTLRRKLDDLGQIYYVFENDGFLEVDILLPPDGKLHFTVKEDEIPRTTDGMKASIISAVQLYDMFGINLAFRPLERCDCWASPFNRNV